LGVSLLLAAGFWGWLSYTTLGQLTHIRWNLTNVSHRASSQYQSEAAVAFAKDENSAEALKLAKGIQNSSFKAKALSAIAEVYGELQQQDKAADLLKEAIASAKAIQDSNSKADALSAIAQAIGELQQPEIAADLLKEAIATANEIQDSNSKANALRAIAEVAANLKNWGQALQATQQCSSEDCKAELLAKVLTVHAE
jgi:tetratricopeptide (TPR) repeat protein